MTAGQISRRVVVDRIAWVERMLNEIRSLPLEDHQAFFADTRNVWTAESYLRRGLGATLDLGRHIVAKGPGPAPAEYKSIAQALKDMGVLKSSEAHLLWRLASYRDRLVHFYQEVSVEELYEICSEGLGDIERVTAALERWLRDHPERMDQEL
ncbi:MAG: DUF86 domain-containing protein [Anaerolineae bacterium]